MAQPRTITDPFAALLDALAGGDVTLAHRALGTLASAYDPGTGAILLNPYATEAEQRAGLADALAALAADLEPPRPSLRVLPGGAS